METVNAEKEREREKQNDFHQIKKPLPFKNNQSTLNPSL